MRSEIIYQDIKLHGAKKSFNYLKKRYLFLIRSKYTLSRDINEAEDRFAQAFTKLYEKINNNEIKNYDNLTAYFLTICKNSFLVDAGRNRVRTTDDLTKYQLKQDVKNIEMSSSRDLVVNLLNKLPYKLRKVNEMIYLEGKDHKEVALELNMNYDNVRKYQYKAINILKSKTPAYYKDYIH